MCNLRMSHPRTCSTLPLSYVLVRVRMCYFSFSFSPNAQGLDFHAILLSGDTEAVRTAWLLSKLTEAPGYLPTKMKRTV